MAVCTYTRLGEDATHFHAVLSGSCQFNTVQIISSISGRQRQQRMQQRMRQFYYLDYTQHSMMGISSLLMTSGAATLAYVLLWNLWEIKTANRTTAFYFFMLTFSAKIVIWTCWHILIYPFYVSPLRHLPIPPGKHWLWGHGLVIFKESRGAPASRWVNTIPNDGIIRYFWFFNSERILLTSPKSVSDVLVTKGYAFQKPKFVRETLGRVLGYGLIFAEGYAHKLQRRKLQPAFAFRQIKELYPLFWDKTRQVVEAMTVACGPHGVSEMEIHSWASYCALDIIGLAGLGEDLRAIEDCESDFVQACDSLFDPPREAQLLAFIRTFVPAWVINSLPIKRHQDLNRNAHIIRKMCLDIVQTNPAKKLADCSTPGTDILSVAMGSGLFSDDELVDQVMAFLAGGQGTTAGTMSWAVYMLTKYPGMQIRLRQEVRSRVSSLEAPVSSVDIDGMPYLQAFCNEVLRYWCPVPVIARTAAEDTTILDYPVRRGTYITISPWAMNRDPAQWGPDAGTFDPDRWMAQGRGVPDTHADRKSASGGASTNYGFATFSHGPRSCIGQNFARAEFACLLAGWVGRFEFALKDDELMDESKLTISGGLVARPIPAMNFFVKVIPGF